MNSKNTHGQEPPVIKLVERDETGQLLVWLKDRDEPVVNAKVARCFPWTFPNQYIVLCDSGGKELTLLSSLDDVSHAPSRKLLEEELRDKVFNPKITKILEFNHEFGITSIRAETDRGEVNFQIRGRDDIRVLSAKRALFRDVDGNTYELQDVTALDAAGQNHLKRYF